ncbi:hypothetical protein ACSBR2_004562 [Camellia fascicularis]
MGIDDVILVVWCYLIWEDCIFDYWSSSGVSFSWGRGCVMNITGRGVVFWDDVSFVLLMGLVYGDGMEAVLFLLFTYGQTNAVFCIHDALTFAGLVDVVCGKFGISLPRLLFFLFVILGYNKFKVDCDDDVQNIVCLAKSFGLHHVDVLIQTRNSGSNIEGGVADCNSIDACDIGDGLTSNMEDQTDLLPFYCPHKSKTLFSTG